MPKSMDIYKRIVEETDRGFFVVYFIDVEKATYEGVLRIDDGILVDSEPMDELGTALYIFDKIKDNLIPGLYFWVSRNHVGSDYATVDTRNLSGEALLSKP